MEENGGFSTLGYLYQNVLKVPGVEWQTKTPYASIRRIVQDERFFFKIKPGLWALKSHIKILPEEVLPVHEIPQNKVQEYDHSYYQGLLVEIGNIKRYKTFVPHQDRNKPFIGKKLGDVVSEKQFFPFTYNRIVKKAQMIDVSWFNDRDLPYAFFEIEYSTDFLNSLIKFSELQDFRVNYYIVSDIKRRNEFERKVSLSVFSPINNDIKYVSFDKVSQWHASVHEVEKIERDIISE